MPPGGTDPADQRLVDKNLDRPLSDSHLSKCQGQLWWRLALEQWWLMELACAVGKPMLISDCQ